MSNTTNTLTMTTNTTQLTIHHITSAPTFLPTHVPPPNFHPPRRSNSGDDQYVELTEGDLGSLGPFNSADPTVVLVHGFANSGFGSWPNDAKTGERWGPDL